jgi:hypothetical protein
MANYTRYVGTIDGKNSNAVQKNLPVASGVTVTAGDFVYWASGRITSATIANTRVVGVVQETATGNASGTVFAQTIVDPAALYLCKNDNVGTTFAASHVGSYFDLTGATGAQLVDTSTTSATDGTLYCDSYNPNIQPYQSDTSFGLFSIAQHAFLNGA